MDLKKILVLFLGFVCSINVVYARDITVTYPSSYTDGFSVYDKLNNEDLNIINDYFNEKYGKSSDNYICFFNDYANYENDFDIDCLNFSKFKINFYSSSSSFGYAQSKYKPSSQVFNYYYNYSLVDKSINIVSSNSYFDYYGHELFVSSNLSFLGFPLWSNHELNYSDFLVSVNSDLNTLSSNDFILTHANLSSINERYSSRYSLSYIYTNKEERLYTIIDRVLEKELEEFDYKIYYYFNDVLDSNYTKSLKYTGKLNDELVIRDLESEINGYKLVDQEYKIVFKDGDNYVNVYYQNDMYNKQFYTINVYLDDVYSSKYSFTSYGDIGSEIDLSKYSSFEDIYFINLEDYHFVINKEKDLNNFSLYYYSEYYGTDYQDISLSDSYLYLFFDYSDIKEFFPGVNWRSFNQYQQIVITIGFNIFFGLFLFLMIYLVFRLLSKLFSFIW